MNLTLTPWEWLSLIGSGLGALFALLFLMGRVLIAQVEQRLDLRFATLEQRREQTDQQGREAFIALDSAVRAHEQRLTQLLIDLPLHYQRRDDGIRQEVAILHRLDALAVKVDHLARCDTRSCPLRDHLPGTP